MARTTARRILGRVAGGLVAAAIMAGAGAGQASATPAVPGRVAAQAQVTRLQTWMVDDLAREWSAWFAQRGLAFAPPTVQVVPVGTARNTACGTLASDDANAFYCPTDRTLWLPLDSMVAMLQFGRFGPVDDSDLTDFDVALVVSHEYGHAVQDLLEHDGVQVRTSIRQGGDVGIEDFADCAAGWWSSTARDHGLLEDGDLDSALRMLADLGDAHPSPDNPDPHGTPDERRAAFTLGFDQGADTCAHRYLGTPADQS